MEDIASIEAVAGVISLAIAPVFLIAGIAGLLGVMSTRLSRITDRAREIERRIPAAMGTDRERVLYEEAASLWQRTRLTNWAIRLCSLGALVVCLVIVTLFVGEIVAFNIAVAVAVLFVAAMLFVISGLILFVREIGVATRQMKIGMETTLAGGSPAAPLPDDRPESR